MEASRLEPTPAAGALADAREVLADYITLTKPKVQSLLILTTVTTMYVAADPSPGRVALTCVGGYLSAGGAGAINHYWDRDIDARMTRTADRPVASGRVSPRAALIYGAILALLSVLVTVVNVMRSLKSGAIAGPDPWQANTLEWFVPSPPPENNFDVIPRVRSLEPMKDIRREIERQSLTPRRPAPATVTADAASESKVSV